MVMPGDQCFCVEIFDFTQCVVARKKIILHWLKLCTFGDDSRGTGSRKMGLAKVYLYTKFEVSNFTRYKFMDSL